VSGAPARLAVERVGRVLWVRLGRPQILNALDQLDLDELAEVVAGPAREPETGAIVLTGSGRAFCAGGDLGALQGIDAAAMEHLVSSGAALMREIESLECPVVAAVNGLALGGGLELALACDIRVASEEAVFGLPEVTLGTIPAWGGTHRLADAVGGSRAAHLLLTGARVDAHEARAIGLVAEIHPADRLEAAAQELAERLAGLEPVAVAAAKRALLERRRAAADAAATAELDGVLAAHRLAENSPFVS